MPQILALHCDTLLNLNARESTRKSKRRPSTPSYLASSRTFPVIRELHPTVVTPKCLWDLRMHPAERLPRCPLKQTMSNFELSGSKTRNITIGIRVNDDSVPESCQKLACCLLVTLHAMRTILNSKTVSIYLQMSPCQSKNSASSKKTR